MKEEITAHDHERHFKRRIFVRELSGTYGDVYRDLLNQPRVYKPKGPKVINPQNTAICQAIETQLEVQPPGWHNKPHGHMNSAIIYILDGKGYDIHDGMRYDYETGDALIVENACVHEHCNTDPKRHLRMVYFKAKPLFLFFNLLFQKQT